MNRGPSLTRMVTIVIVAVHSEGLARMPCQTCQTVLDLCQPDLNKPDRFLATCPGCGEWFLVDSSEHDQTARLISLDPISKTDQKPDPIRPSP